MKSPFVTILTVGVMLTLTNTASAQTASFAGHWKNVDPHTRGLVELEIKVSGAKVDVKALGACDPTPCDVGNTDASDYAPNVGDNIVTTARRLTVRYHDSFSERILVIEPKGANELSAQLYTHFTDGSGRSNYFENAVFRR